MNTSTQARAVLLGLLVAFSGTIAQAQQAGLETAHAYLQANHEALKLTPADIEALVVNSQHLSAPTGITHLYLQQQIDGVPVYNAIVNVAIGRDGRVVHVGNSAVSGLETASRSAAQGLSAEAAVEAAARELGVEVTEPLRTLHTRQAQQGPFESLRLSGGGIASEDIRAQLAYIPTEYSGLRLAWILEFYAAEGSHLWHLGIDAATGEMLIKEDFTHEEQWLADDLFPENWPASAPSDHAVSAAAVSLAPLAAGAASSLLSTTGSYRVYAWPYESPAHAGDPFTDLRTVETNAVDLATSPLGWHNDGVTSWTITRGNNVHAGVDLAPPNGIDPGGEADGGPGLVFDFDFDPGTQNPSAYRDAAVANLFYWNNITHDVTYRYGFDEASGNFQVTNVTGFGTGGDPVRAEAQDYSGTNNANFSTPSADGSPPRMQMFVWNSPFANELEVGAPVNQTFVMSAAGFGPSYPVAGISGSLALVNDGSALPNEGCGPLVGFPAGSIALAYRGTCPFTQKVANAQAAGAVAVVIINNAPGNPITLGGADPTIVIPAGMISQDDGAVVVANLPVSATARNLGGAALNRDSDFDNGVIIHEYAHGISNRLTGGLNVNCLGGQEQMGEGWSDYYALLLTDDNTENRGIGTYVVYEPPSGRGIRPTAYSRDFAVNPSTYATIAQSNISVPHGVGYVWATMLWDMTRDLVDRHGFNQDIYQDWSTGGNNLALQLVTEGLKFRGATPASSPAATRSSPPTWPSRGARTSASSGTASPAAVSASAPTRAPLQAVLTAPKRSTSRSTAARSRWWWSRSRRSWLTAPSTLARRTRC
jgi:extracellular elastinolytic metalloproteinase